MSIYEKLSDIQSEVKVPKTQYNKFGKYYYRNLDDILSALKPHLKEKKLCLFINDRLYELNGYVYLEATVTLIDAETGDKIEVKASARDSIEQSGMAAAQVTGSTSSYARKYALAGLFALDNDDNDPDSMDNSGANGNNTGKTNKPPEGQKQGNNGQQGKKNTGLSGAQVNRAKTKMRVANMSEGDVKVWITKKFGKDSIENLSYQEYEELCNALDQAAAK